MTEQKWKFKVHHLDSDKRIFLTETLTTKKMTEEKFKDFLKREIKTRGKNIAWEMSYAKVRFS